MEKAKLFNIITTVIGILGAIWVGLKPILEGNASTEQIITAVLLGILGYFSKLK